MTTLDALLMRVEALEEGIHKHKDVDDNMRRARSAVEKAGLFSARWKWVPDDYYQRPLAGRAECLGSPIPTLCKSLLMENRKAAADDPHKFVLVVIQYAASLDANKLTTTIRSVYPVNKRPDTGSFEWRIAEESDNARLTGYTHNAVTPFGLFVNVPIVLASAICADKFMWMGGGHIHLKLGMAVSEFQSALSPIVGDVSNVRTTFEDDLDS